MEATKIIIEKLPKDNYSEIYEIIKTFHSLTTKSNTVTAEFLSEFFKLGLFECVKNIFKPFILLITVNRTKYRKLQITKQDRIKISNFFENLITNYEIIFKVHFSFSVFKLINF